jgi:hypothetical protein
MSDTGELLKGWKAGLPQAIAAERHWVRRRWSQRRLTFGAIYTFLMVEEQRWMLLAQRLKSSRRELGYKNRASFVSHLVSTGSATASVDRILGDLERGARSNYSAATLSAIESWYSLDRGEVRRILDSAPEPRPLEVSVLHLRAGDRESSIVFLGEQGWDLAGVKNLTTPQLADLLQGLADELRSR